MLPTIQAMLILQDRDLRLLALAGEMARIPKDEARAKDRLSGDQAAVKKAKDAVMANEMEIKKIEMDAATRKTTIQRLKTQQFETRKNDEFQALGHEITRYESEIDALETKELELMEIADALRSTLSAAEAALATSQKIVDEDLANLSAKSERITEETAELQAERKLLAEKAPESLLPLYERLIKIKNGLGLVPMIDGKCSGCHIKLVASTVVKVNSETEGVQCESCGRLLYLEP